MRTGSDRLLFDLHTGLGRFGQVWDMGQASAIDLGLLLVTSGKGLGQVREAEGRFRVGLGQARGRL